MFTVMFQTAAVITGYVIAEPVVSAVKRYISTVLCKDLLLCYIWHIFISD